MNSVPLTTWEQLGVVCLFIVFVGLVWGFVRWVLAWASKEQKDQRTRWEEYTTKRDKEWREFFIDVHEGDKEVICNLKAAIDTLSTAMNAMIVETKGMRTDLAEHDKKVDKRIEHAVEETGRQINGTKRTSTRKPRDIMG